MKTEQVCTQTSDPCFWCYDPDHSPEEEERKYPLRDRNDRRIRAGVFLYNPKEDKLLVVQAYNKYVGLPKGGKDKEDTSLVATALRELKEETGVELPEHLINPRRKITLYGTATYFIIETEVCYPLNIMGNLLPDNDVSGAGWVHVDCLPKIGGTMTSHLKKMLDRVLQR